MFLASEDNTVSLAQIILIMIGLGGIALTAINLVWTNAVATKANRIDSLKDKLEASVVSAISREINQMKELNDERFDQVWERFKAGEARFEKLEQRDQKLELQIERRLNSIQQDVAVIKRELGIKDGQ